MDQMLCKVSVLIYLCGIVYLLNLNVACAERTFRELLSAEEQDSNTDQHDVGNIYNITFNPSGIEEMLEDERLWVYFDMLGDPGYQNKSMTIRPDDGRIAEVSNNSVIRLDSLNVTEDGRPFGWFQVRGKFLGLTDLEFHIHGNDEDWEDGDLVYDMYEVIVLRKERVVDDVYR